MRALIEGMKNNIACGNEIRMRVLMVTPGYYPIEGGAETMVRNLSIGLNKLGICTDVMAFNMDEKWKPRLIGKIEKIDGLTVFKIPALDWLPFVVHSPRINLGVDLIPGRFIRRLREYDIIHFHEAEFSFPLFSFPIKKLKILHIHALDFDFFKRYYLSRLMLSRSANIYLSITKQMRSDLVRLGIPENKIIYFPNSVDTKIFRPGTQKKDNTILYVGRLNPNKCLHVLLKALDHIRTPVHLVIVGPPSWDQGYYQQLMESIEAENQKGKHEISYLGRVDQAQLIECYQEASIFVLPSVFEPFGIVLLEALSCATPVVATHTGGIPEVIRDGENGILVPKNNHLELAKAIQRLLDNKGEMISMGQIGRRYVVENFSLEHNTKRLADIYEKLLSVS
jgi:glycosyltransferase involved in cell wall biosynthesis